MKLYQELTGLEKMSFDLDTHVEVLKSMCLEHEEAIEKALDDEFDALPLGTRINIIKNRLLKYKENENFLFITINPASDVKFEEFFKAVRKLCNNTSYIKNADYAFEQRGTTDKDIGTGFHVHIVCDYIKGCNPSKVQTNIFSKFKKMCGNKQHVDVRRYPSSMRRDKIMYIKGDKWDPSKMDAVNLNALWRKNNNILDIYNATSS